MNTKNTICIVGKRSPGSFRLRRATWMEKFPTWQNCGNKDIMRWLLFKQRGGRTAVFNVCKLPLLSRTQISNLPRKRKVLCSPAVARNLWMCCKKKKKKWIQMEGYWVKVRITVVCTYRAWCREDGWCSTPSRLQCTSNNHSSGREGGTIISQSVMIGLQVQIHEIKRTVSKIQNISFLLPRVLFINLDCFGVSCGVLATPTVEISQK